MLQKIICVDCLKHNKDVLNFLKTKKYYEGVCSFCRGRTVVLDNKMIKGQQTKLLIL